MKIAFGSDHAGFAYKEKLKKLVVELGHEVHDVGTDSEQPVDYPLFIRPAAEAVAKGECDRAIVLGGSGNGEAIVANRIRGVRCTICWSHETARLAREHNDSNCLSIGQRMITEQMAQEIVRIWLETPFAGGRHARRIAQIDSLSWPPSQDA
jgi:ribose 5-phosphate isomerase B